MENYTVEVYVFAEEDLPEVRPLIDLNDMEESDGKEIGETTDLCDATILEICQKAGLDINDEIAAICDHLVLTTEVIAWLRDQKFRECKQLIELINKAEAYVAKKDLPSVITISFW